MSSSLTDAVRVARGLSRVVSAQVEELINLRWTSVIPSKSPASTTSSTPSTIHHSDNPGKPFTPSEPSNPPQGTTPSILKDVPNNKPTTSSPQNLSSSHSTQIREAVSQTSSTPIHSNPDHVEIPVTSNPTPTKSPPTIDPQSTWVMRERSVPESPLSRVLAFGGLGAGLLAGAAAETARRAVGFSPSSSNSNEPIYSAFVSDANAERLASSLSRMRGAALKLGQMLSIQDDAVIPPVVLKALERVRQGADIMPARQLSRVLARELGEDWRERIVEFDETPIAAASIGQVHRGKIHDDLGHVVDVVFKIQYPGVARSIKSDLNNLKRLVTVGNFIPESFYLDDALKAAGEELERECDYETEAKNQQKYRELVLANSALKNEFYVPKVYQSHSTKHVLVSEFVKGVPIDRLAERSLELRNLVGNSMLRLAMSELFIFGFQQSDPNWSNYLYDDESGKINLIDFGAAREYSEEFLMQYLALIRACATRDREAVLSNSISLGFLTGEETKEMFEAHVNASFAVGEPFQDQNRKTGFDFTKNDIPARTAKFGKVMLQYRLTPPPKEAYSLHRRLSGAFLMSTKLGATVQAAEMLDAIIQTLVEEGRIQK